ncbi:MAG: ATP-dependent helicase, partial [Patescibacteria group bacterium]
KLLAQGSEQGMIEHIHRSTAEDEVRAVLERIVELKDQTMGASWSDFAILVRSNGAGADFAAALDRSSIPFQFLALSGLYQKPVILNSLALLRVIDQPHDSPSLYRVLNMSMWGINAVTIAELNRLATRKGKSLYEAMSLAKGLSPIEPEQLSKLNDVFQVLAKLRQHVQKDPVTELYLRAVKESGYMEYLNRLDERLSHESFGFLQQFFERLKSFESRADQKTLHEFLAEFQHERDAGEEGSLNVDLDAGPDMVRIMTIHGAKGLEFRFVFVVNLVDRKFPTQRRSDAIPIPQELLTTPEVDEAEFHLAEERRLFYVAMTRAKEGLFFTSADNYGGARDRKLSRFLDELGYAKPNEQTQNVFEMWD